jgi:two-component system OmpR family response regulator
MSALRVLVVDDEEELVETLVERLQLRGIQAAGVTSGAAAIGELRATEFSVVVLDVKMPGMGGLEAFEAIRRERPEVRVILLTGHGSEEDAQRGLRAGAVDYLIKPVNLADLLRVIERAAPAGQGPRG